LESFTISWTAEPGIDLATNGAAIATRAYVESYYLAAFTEDDKYLYPGFSEAVAPNESGGPPGTSGRRPVHVKSEPDVLVGTARHRVLGIARSGQDVTLTACAYLYGAAIERPNSQYNALVGNGFAPGPGIYPIRIGLRAPNDSSDHEISQQGPSRAPYDDVFGGWTITSHQGGFLASTSRWAEYDRDLATCTTKADTALSSEHLSPTKLYAAADFPTLPATPGWPAAPTA
jgi:hypothetical protein